LLRAFWRHSSSRASLWCSGAWHRYFFFFSFFCLSVCQFAQVIENTCRQQDYKQKICKHGDSPPPIPSSKKLPVTGNRIVAGKSVWVLYKGP
jgi:hypothetical protein